MAVGAEKFTNGDVQSTESAMVRFIHSTVPIVAGNFAVDLSLPPEAIARAIDFARMSCHPHFFNQLSCGLDIISLAGEWLTAAANTNMFTYEIAPVFILMENVVLEKMRSMIGWSTGDSILAPGGSVSNLYAFLAARHQMFPQYKEKGLTSIPGHLVMFTSDQCHYSVKSCASVCGLGTDYCIAVPSDERGRIIPQELERLVRYHKDRGDVPFFVNATSGTTVLGAFDPLVDIADICQKYNMWMHVDMCVRTLPRLYLDQTAGLAVRCAGRALVVADDADVKQTSPEPWDRSGQLPPPVASCRRCRVKG
ncbi:hypothetical protein MSG28_014929 [Choristoneura fumiferana]|uniref:Uncharacterized protein n=1 Tax=Choristoneura fumiferana TaxID=7141 RepID=A0ACC0KXM5_CHOFU|nr:hypothetical protein MSG28_014929 [Choristoneura fumiferana]